MVKYNLKKQSPSTRALKNLHSVLECIKVNFCMKIYRNIYVKFTENRYRTTQSNETIECKNVSHERMKWPVQLKVKTRKQLIDPNDGPSCLMRQVE